MRTTDHLTRDIFSPAGWRAWKGGAGAGAAFRLCMATAGMLLVGAGFIRAEPAFAEASRRGLDVRVDGPAQVGQRQKIEFILEGPGAFHNPYDPAEVEVNIQIVAPSGRELTLPGFFYQPYESAREGRGGRGVEWLYPSGPGGWRARFAPVEVGEHVVEAVLKDKTGSARSGPLSFVCLSNSSPGFVRVSKLDPRFFEFEDGTPYFPLGHNVAFVGSSQYLDTSRAAEVFRKMGAQGANFARVWACAEDWALAIEARKSAWGRSWAWPSAFVSAPGPDGYHMDTPCVRLGGEAPEKRTVSPSHPVALRPGTAYRLSGEILTEPETRLSIVLANNTLGEAIQSSRKGAWERFVRPFNTASNQWWLGELTLQMAGPGRVWLRQLSLREQTGGPELLWEADLRRAPRRFYNQPDSYMLDRLLQAAEQHGIYLQICLLTRDHYRAALSDPADPAYDRAVADARNLFRYAVARWGYSTHMFAWEYFNEMDPNAPAGRFYRELGEYLQQIDPYPHLRTTSDWGPAPAQWAHPQLDIAQLHWYLRPAWSPLWQDEVAAILDRTALLRRTASNTPALLAEFGLATDAWDRSPHMQHDKDHVHFHNSLWASAFSGLSGAAAFWWWETLDQNNAYPHYRPLADFLAKVPWTTETWQAVAFPTEARNARVLALRGRQHACAWVFNPQAAWWKVVVEKTTPSPVREETFTLDKMRPGTYRVQWWDTHDGKIIGEDTLSTAGEDLQVRIPPFSGDIACLVSLR